MDLTLTQDSIFQHPIFSKTHETATPTKCSVRPLFNTLLLIVFATTVSFRAVLCRTDVNLSFNAWSPQKKTHVLNFNSTEVLSVLVAVSNWVLSHKCFLLLFLFIIFFKFRNLFKKKAKTRSFGSINGRT